MKKYLLPSALILAFGLTLALAQNVNKALQLSQSPGAFGVDTSNNVYFPAHVLSNGKTPTTSNGTVSGTDFQGTIAESANSIGGTLTFATAYLAAPNCVVTGQTGTTVSPVSYSTVTTSLTWSHLSQASKLYSYLCSGAQ